MKSRISYMTASEIIIAATITSLIFAALMPLTMFTVRSVHEARMRANLEQDMLLAKERMKRDLATTSRSLVMMYPAPGSGTRGFSMPVLQRGLDAVGLPLDSSGSIAWNRTVIYHIFKNPENGNLELRRSVFEPRDNSLTPEQRLEQLEATVVQGNGAHNLYGEAHTGTSVLADNVSAYEINAGLSNTDTYAPVRDRNLYQLGTWTLKPGSNDFLFQIVDKNAESSGYDVSMDLLVVSPTGRGLEAESLYPAVLTGGGTCDTRSMVERGFWSNNRGLYFTAGGSGDYMNLEIYNDIWLESTFVDGEATVRDAEVSYDPKIGENILRMAGNRTSWEARIQTYDDIPDSSNTAYAGGTARVLISNLNDVSGGNLAYSGNAGRVRFQAMSGQTVDIAEAWIMESNMDFNGDSTTMQRITFTGADADGTVYNDGRSISFAGTTVESDLISLPLSNEKDYLVSFRFGPATTAGGVPEWHDVNRIINSGFVVADDVGAAGTADWSSLPGKEVVELEYIPALASIYVTYPSSAAYTSSILDTRLDAPPYETLDWNAEVPSGTAVQVRIRSGNEPDLSDAPLWDNALQISAASLPADISGLAGRYVQWQAILSSEPPCLNTASLQDVGVRWRGEKRGCDVAIIAGRGPDKGIFELYVNDQNPAPASLRLFFTLTAESHGKVFEREFDIISFPKNTF